MAIVLKYGAPGPILQSGFAAGVGNRKKKQQDDLLDIYQQQSQQAFQAQQSAIDQQNRVKMQEANFEFQAGQNEQQQKAQLLGRAWQAFGADQKRVQGDMLTERRFAQAEFMKLPSIPEHADAEARKTLTKHKNALAELMGPTWDLTKPEVQKAWQEERDAYQSGVQDLQDSFSPADEENKNTIYRDQSGKAFNDAGLPEEGRIPYDRRTGKPIENPQAEAQAKAQAEQQKEQQKQQEKIQADQIKQQEKIQAAEQKRQQDIKAKAEKLFAETDDLNKPKYKSFGEALKKADEMQSEADSFFTPAAPAATSQQTEKDLNTLSPGQPLGQNQGLQAPADNIWSPTVVQEHLKKYPNLSPDIAKGVTPEVVQKASDWGASDPMKAAVAYATAMQATAGSAYSPETREKILANKDQIGLPTPKTPADFEALRKKPGTAFIHPDGTIRTVPNE